MNRHIGAQKYLLTKCISNATCPWWESKETEAGGMTLTEEKDRGMHNCDTDVILQENTLKAIDQVLRITQLFPLSVSKWSSLNNK